MCSGARTEGLTIYMDCQGVVFALGDSKMTSLYLPVTSRMHDSPWSGNGFVGSRRRQATLTSMRNFRTTTRSMDRMRRAPAVFAKVSTTFSAFKN